MKKIGRLYLITDTAIQNKYSHYQIAILAIKGGADVIQLRDKTLSTSELIQTAINIAALCRKHKVTFLINDRVDVALVSNADGVHLGMEDIPINEARKLLGAFRAYILFWSGKYAHNQHNLLRLFRTSSLQ